MFRSATTRIAHNSTLPSLSTFNKDLKALQELINAEKTVMQTLQKLSNDVGKAAECLRLWGQGEGDDLGDTLNASTTLLLHFATALGHFSMHEAKVREQMKAVRTREENLDEVKRRRKSLVSKADTADRKLGKMSAENKNFQSQADSLNKLREEIRGLDTEILNEEASLGDFKRSTAKYWMGLKFGALMECSSKGMIVGEMGKLIIEEIPLTPTEPGLPRPYYQGHARTEFVITEAQRATDAVTFSIEPSQRPHSLSIRPLPGSELPPLGSIHGIVDPTAPGVYSSPSVSTTPSIAEAPSDMYKRQSQVLTSPSQQFTALPPIRQATDESFGMNPYIGKEQGPSSQPGSPPSQFYTSPAMSSVVEANEFGAYPVASSQFSPRSASLRNLDNMNSSQPTSPIGGPRGPRFATFPSKAPASFAPQFQNQQADRPGSVHSATQGLGGRGPSIDLDRRESVSFSSSIAQALGQDWVSSDQEAPLQPQPKYQLPDMNPKLQLPSDHSHEQWGPPPPRYTATPEHPADSAAQLGEKSYGGPSDDDDDAHLAYAAADFEDHSSHSSEHPVNQGDRHIRFGAMSENDSDPDPQSADQTPKEGMYSTAQQADTTVHSMSPTPQSPRTMAQPPTSPPANHVEVSQASFQEPQHIPPPGTAKEEEERALNAAAAREIAREMDALMFTGVSPPPSNDQPVHAPEYPSSPHSIPAPVRRGIPEDSAVSPTLSAREITYVRQRDRAPSNPVSPTASSDNSHGLSIPPTANETQSPTGDVSHSMPPPTSISLRGTSPTHSFNSAETPFRTPSEFPLPPPAPFYQHPSASGSGSLTSGGVRTISAAAFKRQLRNPTSPVVDGNQLSADTSPLNINKRGLPGSPRPSPRLGPANSGISRLSSAPNPVPGSNGQLDPRIRSVSGAARPQSFAPDGDHGEEDEYDYISAYVDNNESSPGAQRGPGEYGQ
ncbi:hypothetical protein BDY19DRAFT_936171 [Irpex rosettiformis]|uniref:Uncharacterized protein n=1 Tax=Irpex rosettiformis TaxID=378272 RepID=A0ACB8U9I0_9APHY|nr:hypothetical protein BDY19DRAFT_936171 [Irpex rosettiformis]